MPRKKFQEIVYYNHGEIYKAKTAKELIDGYPESAAADPLFSRVKATGKQYMLTQEAKDAMGNPDGGAVSLTGYYLCPAVTLWLALGAPSPHEKENYDLFFAIDSVEQLHAVAKFYGLEYPISEETEEVITNRPHSVMFWNTKDGKPIVLGAIKYINSHPAVLKVYTFPKDLGLWDAWMYGISYYNEGKPWEAGAYYIKKVGDAELTGDTNEGYGTRTNVMVTSERADGVSTTYTFGKSFDPIVSWVGEEHDAVGGHMGTRRFVATSFIRRLIGKMRGGPSFKGTQFCPAIKVWLGYSFNENRPCTNEFYFHVEDSATLEAIARYYDLPCPANADLKKMIDDDPAAIRFRHIDIFQRGTGRATPVVVGSVVVERGEPIRLMLYTFMRPWDFEYEIELPEL